MSRFILLNALPLNAIPLSIFEIFGTRIETDNPVEFQAFILDNLKEASEVQCYIRHPATVQLLSKILGVKLETSSSIYRWEEGDHLLVVTLKNPARGQEVKRIEIDDLELFYIYIAKPQ